MIRDRTKIPGNRRTHRLDVLDVFCGAGGFSEGFRHAGFEIACGIDNSQPAVDTFNANFGLQVTCRDVREFEANPDLIDTLPDTDVIIGSPPCVSFSYSNKLGNADKTEGLRLMKIFFAIVVVKKLKRGSPLLAWYMENVANAIESLPKSYSFAALGLSRLAKQKELHPNATAIRIAANSQILNAAEFGVAQIRKRLFVGELLESRARRRGYRFQIAQLTKTKQLTTVHSIRSGLPSSNCRRSSRPVVDPLDSDIRIPLSKLSDHFYENGAYRIHWQDSRELKIDHPYMGRMSFPENEDRPSRTIVANQFPRSREAILYKSEWGRRGDGEYRGPTLREAASLMSFPITYQFVGNEKQKWMLVGNAVCPRVSFALAVQLLRSLGKRVRVQPRKHVTRSFTLLANLNRFQPKLYDSPPLRRKAARFRSNASKAQSMTVTLTNYDIRKASGQQRIWRCFVTYGIGDGYKVQAITPNRIAEIQAAIRRQSPRGGEYIGRITNGFSERIPAARVLQELYEANRSRRGAFFAPSRLLGEARRIIGEFAEGDGFIQSSVKLFRKDKVRAQHLYALFAVCQIAELAAKKDLQQ